ncbi:MAG TPA: ABC transporter ATP-binding protein [Dictyoglomaceae bacterium]|nr:ABC transporter ATP-binding protein [Dictyoglomaceae bacterium]
MDEKVLIKLDNVKAYYKMRTFEIEKDVRAVDGVSIDVKDNEIMGIAGESGSGKSTLGRVIYGHLGFPLIFIDGEIHYSLDDIEIINSPISLKSERLKDLRWKVISYIPQSSMNVLNPVRKIRDIVCDIIESHKMEKEFYEAKIVESLNHFGLSPSILNLYPYQLSGGMRQRVVITLATIFNPKVIIADEPTSALDVVTQLNLLKLFKNIHKENSNSFVFITHDMSIIANLTDRVTIMYAGKVFEVGDTAVLFEEPLHPYTRFLINSIPQIGDKTERLSIPGTAPNLINPPIGCRFYPRCPFAKEICEKEEPSLVEVAKGHKVACFL